MWRAGVAAVAADGEGAARDEAAVEDVTARDETVEGEVRRSPTVGGSRSRIEGIDGSRGRGLSRFSRNRWEGEDIMVWPWDVDGRLERSYRFPAREEGQPRFAVDAEEPHPPRSEMSLECLFDRG